MLAAVSRVIVRAPRAQGTKHGVASLAEQQLLVDVDGTLGDDLATLPRHQVQELVDQEGGRKGGDAPPWYVDEFPAYGAAEGARVPGLGGGYPGEAVEADGVRALEELGGVLLAVVHA